MLEPNTLRSCWSWSLLSSSLKTFSNVWVWESITSHMARAALQAQSTLSAGLPWPPHCARASAAGPRLVLQPWPFSAPSLECLGPRLGKQEGAEIVFPTGQGGTLWRGSGLAWPGLATAGLADPPGLESVVRWRALLLRGVLWFSVALAA